MDFYVAQKENFIYVTFNLCKIDKNYPLFCTSKKWKKFKKVLTLKKKPTVGIAKVTANDDNSKFVLTIDNVNDEDDIDSMESDEDDLDDNDDDIADLSIISDEELEDN